MSKILENIFLAIRSDQESPDWEVSRRLFLKNAEITMGDLDEKDLEKINKALDTGDKESLSELISCIMEGVSDDLDTIAEYNGDSFYLHTYSIDLKAKKIGRIYKSEIAKRYAINCGIYNVTENDYAMYLKGRGYIESIIELMIENEENKEDSPEWIKFRESLTQSFDSFIEGIIDSFTILPRESS